jgi:O-antigen/teichoic acid export membrane protein
LQKGYISNILPALSMIVSMSAIVIFNRYYPIKGNILAALLIFTVPQLLTAVIPFIKIFKPAFTDFLNFDYCAIKELAARSFKFSSFAIMGALTLQIDYLIMSQTLNPSDVATYSIFSKFFIFLLFIHTAVLTAAWPVFSELNIKAMHNTIKKMIFKYICFGFCIIFFGTLIFYAFSGDIISFLAPNTDINTSFILCALFAAYCMLRVWCDTFATFLQSVNALRIFWIFVPVQIIINTPAQYFLSLKYGLNGILIGLIVSFIFTACIALPYKVNSLISAKM